MKNLFRTSIKIATVSLLLLAATVMTANAQDARLQLDQLDSLSNKASQTVDVRLDERLMQTTARIFTGTDPDNIKIREAIKGIKGIYVKIFSFEKDNEYSPADVESVLSQLRGAGWSRIVTVKSKKDGENVAVYLHMTADKVGGLAVLTIEPKQFLVVNIVGPVDLEKLSELEGSFGVPELGIEKNKNKKP